MLPRNQNDRFFFRSQNLTSDEFLNNSNIFLSVFSDVDIDMISTCESLENLNLEDNPLKRDCQENLPSITKKQILTTPRELEEWEDLSI